MMEKACLFVSNKYQGNRIFNKAEPFNLDDRYKFYRVLRLMFQKNGFDLSTQDINPVSKSSIIIYNEMPKKLPTVCEVKKSYLILWESELIRPLNWDIRKHDQFQKIFTWNDNFIDGSKYYKINFPSDIEKELMEVSFDEKKLVTLIASNKTKKHRNELYSKRIEAINWFEKNHPKEFDLFGIGWDKASFKNKKINRIDILKRLMKPRFKSYKGKIDNKKEVMPLYRFSICFENIKGIPGYITEKIFDSMKYYCIPIYWGAPNVCDYIPKDCFIDFTQFSNYDDLYKKLISIDENRYKSYITSIHNFLNSDSFLKFSSVSVARIIVETVLEKKIKIDKTFDKI